MAEKISINLERCPSESTTDSESCKLKEREGGCAAWLTVGGSILVYYASYGVMNSFGFFQDYYSNDFLRDTPASTIAFIGTMQMALVNLLAAISGPLCDRYGIKYLYLGSGSGTMLTLLMLSAIQPGQFWQVFLIQGFLMGLTIAFGVQPALTVIGQHFSERRALAMGLVSTGAALGGIGFPLLVDQLLPRVGFANALRLAALKVVVCYSVALCISTSKPSARPERKGGYSTLIDFRGFFDLRYAILCVGTWFAVLGLSIPSYYIKTYANAAYEGNTLSKYFLCMMNGCSILGATLAGFLGDRIGRLNLLWPIALVSGCLTLFLWLPSHSMATLVLFVCLYGFSASSVTALTPSVVGQITPDDKLGARIGAFYSVIAVASLVGTPIGGALITDKHHRDGYRWLILFSGTALIVGSAFMLGSRLLHDRDLRKKW
ncbi:MFS general substrate transporter [Decorospora gaudefroyi]|uniref:MFS general substrate transporter n=1 Tax=Decorospora gaudefroyi TaxID=184978 RepID=A0A6A5KVF2_9PLEO|nr:MFS general substrate transporter [Decorospora gaudefroyi]